MRPLLAVAIASMLAPAALADDAAHAAAIVDKAIAAAGGAKALGKAKAVSWKASGMLHLGPKDAAVKLAGTAEGLGRMRQEFEGDFGKHLVVIDGNQGWRKFEDQVAPLPANDLKAEQRVNATSLALKLLLPLKSRDFRLATAADEAVDGKPCAGVKAVGPRGHEVVIQFSKETGLPAKTSAQAEDEMGRPFLQEIKYFDFRAFDGAVFATKLVSSRNGVPSSTLVIEEFKLLDKAPAGAFDPPK